MRSETDSQSFKNEELQIDLESMSYDSSEQEDSYSSDASSQSHQQQKQYFEYLVDLLRLEAEKQLAK